MGNNQPKNKMALGLMSCSLLCLGIFLAVWLHRLYNQEIERLQEKSSFILISSLQKAEKAYLKDGLMAAFEGIETVLGDSININLTSFKVKMEDEEDETILYEKFDSTGLNIESSVEIRMGVPNKNTKNRKTLGNIATWIVETNDSIAFDSLSTVSYTHLTLPTNREV